MAMKRAVKKAAKLRIALVGPSGSGKTLTALRIAAGLVPGGRIGVIDTEHASANVYAGDLHPEGVLDFDVDELGDHSPDAFVRAIEATHDFDVLIVDSLSHAWDGVLDVVDKATARSVARGGKNDTFGVGWREGTPAHKRILDAVLSHPGHVIVTIRAKTEYVIEGKTIRKLGLAPVQRAGIEYEFGIVADVILETHALQVTKTRCQALDGGYFPLAGGDFAQILREWLDGGEHPSEYLARVFAATGISEANFDDWSAGLKNPRPPVDSMTDGQKHAAASYLEGDGAAVVRAWLAKQAAAIAAEEPIVVADDDEPDSRGEFVELGDP